MQPERSQQPVKSLRRDKTRMMRRQFFTAADRLSLREPPCFSGIVNGADYNELGVVKATMVVRARPACAEGGSEQKLLDRHAGDTQTHALFGGMASGP